MRRIARFTLVVLALAMGLLASGAAWGVEVVVQTQANRFEADVGSRVLSVANSAVISVAVTDGGLGVGTLGSSIGNGTFSISLPSEWLFAVNTSPPLGCGFTTTEFI